MTFNKLDVLIVTHDVRLNQTFTNRYKSFDEIINKSGYNSKVLGFDFPFKPYSCKDYHISDNFESLKVETFNPIQKLILFADNRNLSFSKKKFILALHLLFFSVDQWLVNKKDLHDKNLKASIIIAGGGGGGIIQTASYLADKYDAKLVLDYRDPWNFGYHLLNTNLSLYKIKRYFTLKKEVSLLKKADHIITVSTSLKKIFPEAFHHKISVIENGSNYEYEDIKDKINPFPKIFNILYLGTIYNDQLLDETFFLALKDFIEQHKITNDLFKIYFLGSNLNSKLTEVVSKYNLNSFTVVTERLDEEDMLPYLLNASVFLHLKYGNRSQIITSKNANYLMFKKPIILPISDKGDLAESIIKYKAGYVCNGIEETVNALNKEYAKFINKEKITLDNGDFSFMSRSEISKKLITVIETLKD